MTIDRKIVILILHCHVLLFIVFLHMIQWFPSVKSTPRAKFATFAIGIYRTVLSFIHAASRNLPIVHQWVKGKSCILEKHFFQTRILALSSKSALQNSEIIVKIIQTVISLQWITKNKTSITIDGVHEFGVFSKDYYCCGEVLYFITLSIHRKDSSLIHWCLWKQYKL